MTSRPERVTRIGELVGSKYRIVRMLAEGGMGVVYEAQHTVVRRRFAVKFLRPDLAERRDILTRFQREAEAAGALESEHIAASVDFGIVPDGTPYIVMEYLVGESLAALLEREGRLSVARAADLVAQASRGIQIAHSSGIIHRDLKPQNLFVCRRQDGTDLLKILDFGVAKLQAIDEMNASTRTGTVLGTVAYMSPEQARGDKIVDQRSDVYALGAILYELVSLKKPHPGESHNAVLHHIATQAAVPLESVQPGLPDAFVEIVARSVSSNPATRPPSAEALAEALASFAERTVWAAPKIEDSGPTRAEVTSTLLARDERPRVTPPASSLAGMTLDDRAAGAPPPSGTPVSVAASTSTLSRRGLRALVAATAAAAVVTTAVAFRSVHRVESKVPRARVQILGPGTRFFSADPQPEAAQQIDGLMKAKAFRDAALLNVMVATPKGFWFTDGSPETLRNAVRSVVTRAARQERIPILVTYNHTFNDCTGYGTSGVPDSGAYGAWIDGFADGIGNEKAVVLLELNSLGLIPYITTLDGKADQCRPTIADTNGKRVAAPGATPEQRFADIRHALDSLTTKAPNAAVYLDGTHSAWLSVGDAAYRLTRAEVGRAAGFFLNVGNYQPTRRLIQYGTWVSKCIYYASKAADAAAEMKRYRECASPTELTDPNDDKIWSDIEDWYRENVDNAPGLSPGPATLTHFVISTARNGLGTLQAAHYGQAPFNQPPKVVEALRKGGWCMPPGAGLGIRPTVDTGVPQVDAFLWAEPVGGCDESCDIAGGARAWDYSKYNPWGITGDAQNHFDPLWGMVLPANGTWFPEEALQLARNANPPLLPAEPTEVSQAAPAPAAAAAPRPSAAPPPPFAASANAAEPAAPTAALGRSLPSVGASEGGLPRAARRHGNVTRTSASSTLTAAPAAGSASPLPSGKAASVPITFDQQNPYK